MARAKRRTFSTPKRRSRRADWVYRHNVINAFNGGTLDLLGTYEPSVLAQSAGVASAQSHVLYDSKNYIGDTMAAGSNYGSQRPVLQGQARARGRKPAILRTEGWIGVEPSTWALGQVLAMGARIGAFEQDGSGVFSVDPAYSMWVDNVATPFEQVGWWANNARSNAWERRMFKFFGDSSTTPWLVIPVSWRGRRTLFDHECWGLYTEVPPTAVNTRVQYWLRSLVEAAD